MGDALEVVDVVLANSIALGSPATAVVAWRGSRVRPPQVRLERNGVVVTVQDSSPETVERILAMWNGSAARGGDAE
ncbi:effector-associated constant component EACC1 [Streptomyces niveus]|uniref:effector-associated constant component EACC1 n=1 Tax=Streptomyces niveus TaxID=193462 RepID=UPI00342050A0